MKERINDKIKEIEKFLEELEDIIPSNLEEYEKDFKTKAACERYAEKIIEAVVDLAYLVIKYKKLELPEGDAHSFDILTENKLISKELSEKLKDAKSMRNILAHKYGEINDKIVFNSLKEELINDINQFIVKVTQ